MLHSKYSLLRLSLPLSPATTLQAPHTSQQPHNQPVTRAVLMATLMEAKIVDHYKIIGLPSGKKGSKLSLQEISTAYKAKALQLHPDKRPNDPNAAADFQTLHSSYLILKDEKSRKVFDDQCRAMREKLHREIRYDMKRQKLVSELKRRERSGFEKDSDGEKTKRKLREELARFRAKYSKVDEKGRRSKEGGVDAEKPREEISNLVGSRNHEELERYVIAKMMSKACNR